jgi:H+/Cl- antiporter ClcA
MSEHLFVKKRQRQRRRAAGAVTTRHILGLILLCLAAYAAFRIWVGNPMESLCGDDCESMHSLLAWVLGFAMIFLAIIAAGAVGGVVLALVRKRRGETGGNFAARYFQATEEAENHAGTDAAPETEDSAAGAPPKAGTQASPGQGRQER